MKAYKLADNNKTRGDTTWGENVTHTTPGGTPHQCGAGWLHAYSDPRLASLLHPAHVNYTSPILWEAEAEVAEDLRDKLLCTSITTIRQIPLPAYSTEQRVEFAIRCALRVHRDEEFVTWADRWLSGEDRSAQSARTAAWAAWAARAAAWAAARVAAEAAWAAAEAAAEAARAAARAAALAAAWAQAWATARAAAWAARAAEEAAEAGCDLISILDETEAS